MLLMVFIIYYVIGLITNIISCIILNNKGIRLGVMATDVCKEFKSHPLRNTIIILLQMLSIVIWVPLNLAVIIIGYTGVPKWISDIIEYYSEEIM